MAKLLRSNFPEIAEDFIHQCEIQNKFPSSVFCSKPSFEQLEKTALPGIPDDQLLRIVRMTCPKSHQPSLFVNTSTLKEPLTIPQALSSNLPFYQTQITQMSPIIRVTGHFDFVFCLAVDATSQLLITGADDSLIKIWKIPSMTLIDTINTHLNVITDIQISPSNQVFAASSHDFTITINSLHDGSLIKKIEFQSEVHSIRFSPNGEFLAAALEEGAVDIFNTSDYSLYHRIITPSGQASAWVSFSPGGEFLSFSSEPSDVCIFSMTKHETITLSGHQNLPDYLFFSKLSCNNIISYSTKEKSVKLWTAKNNLWELEQSFSLRCPTGQKMRVVKCYMNCDETNLVAISSNTIFCWDLHTKKLITSVSHPIFTEHCTVLSMHPYMPNVAFIGCSNGRSSIWDTKLGNIIVALQFNETAKLTESIWSNDGQYVIAADSLGGFTFYGFTHSKFVSLTEFFDFELNDTHVNDHSNRIIYDAQGEALVPQPERVNLQDIRIDINPPQISSYMIIQEKELLRKWKKVDKEKFSTEQTNDEDNESQTNQNENITNENEDSNFSILNSRMSTRHSISIFDLEQIDKNENEEQDQQQRLILTGRRTVQPRSFSPPPRKKRKHGRHKRTKIEDTSKDAETSPRKKRNYVRKSRTSPPNSKRDTKSDKEIEQIAKYSTRKSIVSRKYSPEKVKRNKRKQSTKRTSLLSRRISPPPKLTRKTKPKEEDDEPIEDEDDEIPLKFDDWVYIDKQKQKTFIPQKGDEVIYIRKAHKKFAEECKVDTFEPPYKRIKNLPEFIHCIVSDTEFMVTSLLLTLSIKLNSRQTIKCNVYYPLPLSPPFIILKTTFDTSIRCCRTLTIGRDIEHIKSDEEIFNSCITGIRDDWEEDPYESLTIDHDPMPLVISPWDIVLPQKRNCLTQAQKFCAQTAGIIQKISKAKEFSMFTAVNKRFKESKLIAKALKPMDLNILSARMENEYYRTLPELISDVKNIGKLWTAMNPKAKQSAKELMEEIFRELRSAAARVHITFPKIK
ncbi:bromodomain and WD repeat-containing protein 3-like protein [Histomonas meleagridis]|uniref:bromodomain and WD repeat-containing protein 3-like protein n=1 Tax=Histomonas meleagridis TaxID=135588 RepID=UPI00355A7C91|nr:bromodomain and WD repeat-containing protein 3-like protein [Histomonas meleagridis]KAH0801017.1 bromodomain and WD repeat-containing protein 3-like protein [Histomonas meleagridis]